MELQHRQSQTCGFAHPGSRILQVTFPEHGAGDEDGGGTGLIIRDITDTLDNAGDSLLAVAHTSGRARYACRTGGYLCLGCYLGGYGSVGDPHEFWETASELFLYLCLAGLLACREQGALVVVSKAF